MQRTLSGGLALVLLVAVAGWLVQRVHGDGPLGAQAMGLWWLLAAWLLLLWFVLGRLALLHGRLLSLLAPALLGAALLLIWEVLAVGWEVPRVLLPAPHAVGQALATSADKADRDLARSIASFIEEMSSTTPSAAPSRAPAMEPGSKAIDMNPRR